MRRKASPMRMIRLKLQLCYLFIKIVFKIVKIAENSIKSLVIEGEGLFAVELGSPL